MNLRDSKHVRTILNELINMDTAEKCWCGEKTWYAIWCREHAPHCRSGAHFYGNCFCRGDR